MRFGRISVGGVAAIGVAVALVAACGGTKPQAAPVPAASQTSDTASASVTDSASTATPVPAPSTASPSPVVTTTSVAVPRSTTSAPRTRTSSPTNPTPGACTAGCPSVVPLPTRPNLPYPHIIDEQVLSCAQTPTGAGRATVRVTFDSINGWHLSVTSPNLGYTLSGNVMTITADGTQDGPGSSYWRIPVSVAFDAPGMMPETLVQSPLTHCTW